jgi:hypothetical protein
MYDLNLILYIVFGLPLLWVAFETIHELLAALILWGRRARR